MCVCVCVCVCVCTCVYIRLYDTLKLISLIYFISTDQMYTYMYSPVNTDIKTDIPVYVRVKL